jgi:hypothetical protein
MHQRSRFAATVLVVVSLCVGIVVSAAVGAGAGDDDESWLYVIDAQSATADGDRLTFVGMDPIAVGFTDRPKRAFGRASVLDLVEQWDEAGFTEDPPNAAIAWFDDEGEHTVAVELSGPRETPDGVTFAYSVLEKHPKTLRSRSAEVVDELPRELENVVVFIDAFPTSVNSQVTD